MAGPGPLHADFQLPALFPGEDNMILHKEEKERKGFGTESDFPSHIFPTEFPYDSFDSALSSETETDSSDEDDFFAGLSRRLNKSSSRKLVTTLTQDKNEKSGGMATSPQSTLSGVGSWSFHSNGSSNVPSQAPSPPITPIPAQDEAWDLIYAAAGEISRLKMNGEAPKRENEGINQNLARNQTNSGLYSNRNLATNLYQSNQFQVVKPQCGGVWGQQINPNWQIPARFQQPPIQRARNNVRCGLSHSNSGMQAVFLGGAKRECAGTGVFLPRRYGNGNPNLPPEYRKKTGCSAVLVPAKVIQALNLNLEEINGQSQLYRNAMARRNAALLQQQRL